MPKQYISQLVVGGVTYDIKDLEARALAAGGIHYIGVLKDVEGNTLTDGSIKSPVIIENGTETGLSLVPNKGDLVLQAEEGGEHTEYLWNGEHWDRLGYGKFGDLAYKNSAVGTVDLGHGHNFTLEDATAELTGGAISGMAVSAHEYTPAGTIAKGTGTANYTPEGTVTLGGETAKDVAISGKTADATIGAHTYTPAGNVEVTTASPNTGETANYTPSGTVSKPTFTGTADSLTHAPHKHGATFTGAEDTFEHTVTQGTVTGTVGATFTGTEATIPVAGTVSKPTFTGTEETIPVAGTVSAPTATTTALEAEVKGEVLRFSTGSVTVTAPTFTGTGAKYTPKGTISQPTFTGTGAKYTPAGTIAATFSNGKTAGVAVADHTYTPAGSVAIDNATVGAHSYTPKGTISQPTFTGGGVVIKATFAGTLATLNHTAHSHGAGTLAGSVDVPTTATFAGKGVQLVFNGSKQTLAHTVTQGTVSGSVTYKKLKAITAYSGTKQVTVK